MGFKEGLRPFIGLDGTFLKGNAKGQLLIVVGQDSMNQFYPLAWAVVDKETKRTWIWFLQQLQNSLELHNGKGITFISDMQKRFCVKHIEANWCKRWRKGELKKLLWWGAWSSYAKEFGDQLEQMKQLDEPVVKDLISRYPPETWCRAYLNTVDKNQEVDNNFTESFNSWILEARYKPIIGMLDDIRIKVMNRSRENDEFVSKWYGLVNPNTMKLYNEYLKIAQVCKVNGNGDSGYEVIEGHDRHVVNLSKEAFKLAYKHKLQPVRGIQFWNVDPSQAMEPPALVKLAGRPRIKRDRGKDEALKRQGEWKLSRKGRVMTCNNCREPNHNVRGCG
ncbi:uncharacterized protein LOC129894590 [Solanum dulcamara]|uniref:uncharacterized protein LOC129894590 n=1 Tax=Solanum dulcamara TaxID=45834 RepID=UPI0024858F21|nr:uncharacterized protein LOC129894590 [Solanum dulcamara]